MAGVGGAELGVVCKPEGLPVSHAQGPAGQLVPSGCCSDTWPSSPREKSRRAGGEPLLPLPSLLLSAAPAELLVDVGVTLLY